MLPVRSVERIFQDWVCGPVIRAFLYRGSKESPSTGLSSVWQVVVVVLWCCIDVQTTALSPFACLSIRGAKMHRMRVNTIARQTFAPGSLLGANFSGSGLVEPSHVLSCTLVLRTPRVFD